MSAKKEFRFIASQTNENSSFVEDEELFRTEAEAREWFKQRAKEGDPLFGYISKIVFKITPAPIEFIPVK